MLIRELDTEIIKYTCDEEHIYLSMVCKLWNEILEEMYDDKINYNNPYSLKMFFKQFGKCEVIVQMDIFNIFNRNCLNLIIWKVCNGLRCDCTFLYNLLIQCCVTNNVYKLKNMKKLIVSYSMINDLSFSFMDSLILTCYTHRAYELGEILLNFKRDNYLLLKEIKNN